MRLLITGGAGFIGSAVVRLAVLGRGHTVVNLDKLTYAADLEALAPVEGHPGYAFARGDVCDAAFLDEVFARHEPDAVMHLAAETHVDRSIDGPMAFVQTNIIGTAVLLEAALRYWQRLPAERAAGFRFHHVSTDEVFGSLGAEGRFTETTRYEPNSPYSASKAGSDHLVHAWHKTYGLPVVMSNCSNNYGPFQFPEKLIPLVIGRALEGRELPVYGTGENVRDWLYVDDHAEALLEILERGTPGESYNVGGEAEMSNLDVVRSICALLDEMAPPPVRAAGGGRPRAEFIRFVADRPGHDKRYAMDISKIRRELGWRPRESFTSGLRRTVRWYIDNRDWVERARRRYDGGRLGLTTTRRSGTS